MLTRSSVKKFCKNFQYCYAYHSPVQKNDSASRLCASRVQCIINSATACENLAFDVTDGIIEFRSFQVPCSVSRNGITGVG